MNETLVSIAIAVGVPMILGIIARVFPKQKALNLVGKPARKFGQIVSALGNSKLGAKAMNQIEEGPISTVTAMLIHAVKEFEAGLNEDNLVVPENPYCTSSVVKKKMEKKVPGDIKKAFDEAFKK